LPAAELDKTRITLHVDTVIDPPRKIDPPIDSFREIRLPAADIAAIELADWTDHEWLFQVVLYLVNAIFGAGGLVLLRVALIIGMFLLLFKMASRWSSYLIVVYVSLVVIIASNLRFFMRPEIFSLFFTVYTLFCLHQFKYGSKKWIYSLPPLIFVWTNMHGFFAVGLAMVAFFLISELIERFRELDKAIQVVVGVLLAAAGIFIIVKLAQGLPKKDWWEQITICYLFIILILRGFIVNYFKWHVEETIKLSRRDYLILIGVLVASFAVTFINPYGVEGATFPYKQLGFAEVFHQKISELKSPFTIKTHVIVKGLLFFKIILFAGMPILLLCIRRVKIFWLVVFGVAAWQAAKSNRNIALFALGAHVPLCISVQVMLKFAIDYVKKWEWQKNIRIAAGLVFVVIFIWLFWSLVTSDFYVSERNTKRFGFGWSEFAYPGKAATWVRTVKVANPPPGVEAVEGIPGIMFNNFDTGNYLIYRFFPWKRTFIDGRTEVYGHHYYGDIYYNIMAPNPRDPDKAKYLDRYLTRLKVAFVLVKHSSNDIGNLPERLYANYQLARGQNGQPVKDPKTGMPFYYPTGETKWVLIYLDETACVFVRRNVEILDYLSEAEKTKLRMLAQQYEMHPGSLQNLTKTETFKDVSEASRPFFHYNRGRYLKAIRQHNQALVEFQKAVELRDDIEDFHNGYAAALYLVNHIYRAELQNMRRREENRVAEQFGNDPSKWPENVRRGINQLQNRIAQTFDPNHGFVFTDSNGKEHTTLKECFEHMKKAVELNPGYFEAWKNMKIMYGQIGDLKNALRCHLEYGRILKLDRGGKDEEYKRWRKERDELNKAINRKFMRGLGPQPSRSGQQDLDIGGPRFRGDFPTDPRRRKGP
jgi:tetratricopeptide (TPR) repeat protein